MMCTSKSTQVLYTNLIYLPSLLLVSFVLLLLLEEGARVMRMEAMEVAVAISIITPQILTSRQRRTSQ